MIIKKENSQTGVPSSSDQPGSDPSQELGRHKGFHRRNGRHDDRHDDDDRVKAGELPGHAAAVAEKMVADEKQGKRYRGGARHEQCGNRQQILRHDGGKGEQQSFPGILPDQIPDAEPDQHPFDEIDDQNERQTDHGKAERPDEDDPFEQRPEGAGKACGAGSVRIFRPVQRLKKLSERAGQILLLLERQRIDEHRPENDAHQEQHRHKQIKRCGFLQIFFHVRRLPPHVASSSSPGSRFCSHPMKRRRRL